jgi:hypothetical protein
VQREKKQAEKTEISEKGASNSGDQTHLVATVTIDNGPSAFGARPRLGSVDRFWSLIRTRRLVHASAPSQYRH